MRSVSANFQTVLESSSTNSLVELVHVASSTPILRALDWPTNVTFGGLTYVGDSATHSQLINAVDGTRPGMTLTVQNVGAADGSSLPWSTFLNSVEVNGAETTFRVVSTDYLNDASAVLQEVKWFVSGWKLEGDRLQLKLGSPHDALALNVPARPLVSSTCHWRYKVGACTSTATYNTCDKTLANCKARFDEADPLRIGPSFPFVTRARRRR